jgi:hypothetical protein
MNPQVASVLATVCLFGIFGVLTVLTRQQHKSRGTVHQAMLRDIESVEQFWTERVEPKKAATVVDEAGFSSQLLNLQAALEHQVVEETVYVAQSTRSTKSDSLPRK